MSDLEKARQDMYNSITYNRPDVLVRSQILDNLIVENMKQQTRPSELLRNGTIDRRV